MDSQSVRSSDRALNHCVMVCRGNVHTFTAQSLFLLTWLRLHTGPYLHALGKLMVTTHDFAVEVGRSICKAQYHARMHLGTSRRQKKSYYDLPDHGSPFEVDNCVWLKKTIPTVGDHFNVFRQWVRSFTIVELLSQTSDMIPRCSCPQSEPFVAHFKLKYLQTLSVMIELFMMARWKMLINTL